VPAPNGTIGIGCTVGVAVFPADATDSQGLMTLADQLMYRGKRSGRDRFVTATELKRAS
jgi:GGDEF domain-containing protein